MKNLREELIKVTESINRDSGYYIAKQLLSSYQEGIFLSQKQLSKVSNVSEASITLFAQRIGLSGYRELIFFLQEEYNRYKKMHFLSNDAIKINNYHNLISKNLDFIDKQEAKIEAIAKKIKSANWVYIYSSYDQKHISEMFYDCLQNIKKELVFSTQRKNDLRNIEKMAKGDIAFCIISGLDNAFLVEVFNRISNKNNNEIILLATESQLKKIKIQTTSILLPPKSEIDQFDVTKTIYLAYIFNYFMQILVKS